MKPKSFNRNMRRELADTLAAHGIVAVVAAIATVSAWDYASWWMASLASDLSTLLHLQVGDPGPSPTPSSATRWIRSPTRWQPGKWAGCWPRSQPSQSPSWSSASSRGHVRG